MAHLEIVNGERAGERIELDQDGTTVGRGADNAVTVNDAAMSTRHCCIVRNGNRFSVSDFDSTNGTFLNDERVKDAALRPGDVIKAGDVEFLVKGDDIEVDADAAPALQPTIVTGKVGTPPAAFAARKSHASTWIAVGIVTVLVVGYLAYLLFQNLYMAD